MNISALRSMPADPPATKAANIHQAETIIFCSGDVDPSSRLLRSQPKLRKCPPFILAFHDCC